MKNFWPTFLLSIFALSLPQDFQGLKHFGPIAAAAENSDDFRIARILEGHISAIIARHIPENEFNLTVTLGQGKTRRTPAVSAKDEQLSAIPYMPDKDLASLGIDSNTPIEQLIKQASQVKIVIYLTTRFKNEAKSRIKSLLIQKLALNTARGDTVTFEALRINVDRPTEMLEQTLKEKDKNLESVQTKANENEKRLRDELDRTKQSLSKTEAELREIRQSNLSINQQREALLSELNDLKSLASLSLAEKQKLLSDVAKLRTDLNRSETDLRAAQAQVNVLTKERGDLKLDLTTFKTHKEKLDKEVSNREKEISELKKEKQKIEETGVLKRNIGPGMVALGLFAVGVFLALALWLGLRIMAQRTEKSVSSIGRAIEKVAQTQHQGASHGSNQPVQGDFKQQRAQPATESHPVSEVLQEQLNLLRAELLGKWSSSSTTITLKHISHLLSHQDSIARAVLCLEFLGTDFANKLFQELSTGDQNKILRFLEAGRYPTPKQAAMLAAGQEIQTKLLAENFHSNHMELDGKLEALLLKLGDQGLLYLAMHIPEELIPRYLCYLSSQEAAMLLSHLKQKQPQQLQRFLSHFRDIPTARTQTYRDQELLPLIHEALQHQDQATDARYLEFCRDVMDQLDSSDSQELFQEITRDDETLRAYFEEHVVGTETLLRLQAEYRQEVLSSLQAIDIAILLITLPSAKHLFQELSPQLQEIVKDEVAIIRGSPQRKLKDLSKQTEKRVIAAIKNLAGERQLKELLEPTASANIGYQKSS